jgi:hypothetical protein
VIEAAVALLALSWLAMRLETGMWWHGPEYWRHDCQGGPL